MSIDQYVIPSKKDFLSFASTLSKNEGFSLHFSSFKNFDENKLVKIDNKYENIFNQFSW